MSARSCRRGRRRARPGRALAVSIFAPVVALVLSIALTIVQTSANSVTAKRADEMTDTITANKLKPSQCSALTLTATVRGTTTVNGAGRDELILAGAGIDSIDGKGGSDCILGGDGSDIINGGAGTDVCIGGPGTDTFTGCETQIQ